MARERIHPEGTDATYRVQESLKALVQQGGARKTFRLKPDANKALQQLVKLLQVNTETEAVETAIMRLRTALGDKKIIATVVKRGYRLAVDPDQVDALRLPATAAEARAQLDRGEADAARVTCAEALGTDPASRLDNGAAAAIATPPAQKLPVVKMRVAASRSGITWMKRSPA
mgnify:CR=1 FL=1